MSYIDDELKIGIEEEEDEDSEEDLNDDSLDVLPEEDDLLDDEFIGLSEDSEY